jgi:hypothetical protein
MKKNRPGVKLTVLCSAAQVTRVEKIIFRETSTLGIRRWIASRHKLPRTADEVQTKWGNITGKVAMLPGGGLSFSPEFESCRAIAEQHDVPLRDVYDAARTSFAERSEGAGD